LDEKVEVGEAQVFVKDEDVATFNQLPINDKLKQVLSMNGFENLTKI
jgi:hypothetical protein